MLAAGVVGGTILAILCDQPIKVLAISVMRNNQRLDLCAQEMVGAGRAHRRQRIQLLRVHKFQNLGHIGEMHSREVCRQRITKIGLELDIGNEDSIFNKFIRLSLNTVGVQESRRSASLHYGNGFCLKL